MAVQTSAYAYQQHSSSTTDGAGDSSEAGRILLRVFAVLDRAGIPYCVLHGYENYPAHIKSDVDCIVERSVTPRSLVTLLRSNRQTIGAEVVRCQDRFIVLAGQSASGSPCFLTLDLSVNCEVNDLPLQDGQVVLSSRRRHRQFWVPAPDVEFGAYLARTIAKGRVEGVRGLRLVSLYHQDPTGCDGQAARLWKSESRELIIAAIRSGCWDEVNRRRDRLCAELRRRAIARRPLRFIRNKFHALTARACRILRPPGVSVVLLGPDGAGKSSVIEALGPKLEPALPRNVCWGFAPPLLSLLRQRKRTTNQPHGLPARSLVTSLMRLGYWFAYHMFSFVGLRLALARSTLVLYDRHFVDILVDAKRYRYGGPAWTLRLLWQLIPKPDLVILLDAPPQVLQARKQEVPFEVTASQCQAYLSLIRTLRNGRIVDASESKERVADKVAELILAELRFRFECRFKL
jgi:thymidylate kinase